MTSETPLTLAAFQDMLDAFGADPRRWPADRRAAAQSLLGTSAEARLAVHEARALDAVLSAAPRAPAPDAATAARIAAVAIGVAPRQSNTQRSAPQSSKAESNVVALDSRRGAVALVGAERDVAVGRRSELWRTATALAASLVTGLLIGTFDIAPAAVRNLASLGQSERYVDYVVTALQNDGLSTLFDEDYL